MPITDFSKLHVLEWSRSQKCFHIHSLDDCAESNVRGIVDAYRTGHMPDYVPIAFSAAPDFFQNQEEEDMLRQKLEGLG